MLERTILQVAQLGQGAVVFREPIKGAMPLIDASGGIQ